MDKGHDGFTFNEIADRIADKAAYNKKSMGQNTTNVELDINRIVEEFALPIWVCQTYNKVSYDNATKKVIRTPTPTHSEDKRTGPRPP